MNTKYKLKLHTNSTMRGKNTKTSIINYYVHNDFTVNLKKRMQQIMKFPISNQIG